MRQLHKKISWCAVASHWMVGRGERSGMMIITSCYITVDYVARRDCVDSVIDCVHCWINSNHGQDCRRKVTQADNILESLKIIFECFTYLGFGI